MRVVGRKGYVKRGRVRVKRVTGKLSREACREEGCVCRE